MMSLRELLRAARVLETHSGAVVRKIVQPDDFKLVLALYAPGGNVRLQLCCSPEFARVSLLDDVPRAPAVPPALAQYLRAHAGRAVLEGVRSWGGERQLALELRAREERLQILLSIFGPRSNLYVLDAVGNVVHAMRPLQDTRRELSLGAPWKDPAGAPPSEGDDRWEGVPDAEFLSEVERTFRKLEESRAFEALDRRLRAAIGRERTFLERKAVNLLEDLGEAKRADRFRRRGELLKGVLHEVRPGDTEARAADYETGETVTIPLDPKLSPAENLAAFFESYQKKARSVEAIEEQVAAVHGQIGALDALQDGLERVEREGEGSLEALEALATQPELRRLVHRHFPARRPPVRPPKRVVGKREVPARLMPRRYATEDGLEVWVGKSDEGNDYLTTRLAHGNDLFFHLEGYPGSHVILRTAGRKDPPPTSLLAACELAVHFSRLKDATRADVHVAPVKNIHKPRGAKQGLVYVRGGKTIHLRRDARRLQGILSSRIEE